MRPDFGGPAPRRALHSRMHASGRCANSISGLGPSLRWLTMAERRRAWRRRMAEAWPADVRRATSESDMRSVGPRMSHESPAHGRAIQGPDLRPVEDLSIACIRQRRRPGVSARGVVVEYMDRARRATLDIFAQHLPLTLHKSPGAALKSTAASWHTRTVGSGT